MQHNCKWTSLCVVCVVTYRLCACMYFLIFISVLTDCVCILCTDTSICVSVEMACHEIPNDLIRSICGVAFVFYIHVDANDLHGVEMFVFMKVCMLCIIQPVTKLPFVENVVR